MSQFRHDQKTGGMQPQTASPAARNPKYSSGISRQSLVLWGHYIAAKKNSQAAVAEIPLRGEFFAQLSIYGLLIDEVIANIPNSRRSRDKHDNRWQRRPLYSEDVLLIQWPSLFLRARETAVNESRPCAASLRRRVLAEVAAVAGAQ